MADRRPNRSGPRRLGGDGEPQVFTADEQHDVDVDVARWSALALAVLLTEGVRGAAEMNVLFVDRDTIAEMNEVHLGHTGPTDVLSFPIDAPEIELESGPGSITRGPSRPPTDPDDAPLILGDVVICPAVAVEQAPGHAGTVDDELALLLVHGILHVLGHDHAEPDEAEVMRSRERTLLEDHHWHGPTPAAFRHEPTS